MAVTKNIGTPVWSASGLPDGLNITQEGKITGTPNVQPGNYTATITVTTNYGSTTQTITIKVAVPPEWLPSINAGQVVTGTTNVKITDYTIQGTNIR